MAMQPKDLKLASNTDSKAADKLETLIDLAMANRGFDGRSFDYETDVEITDGVRRELERRYHGWNIAVAAPPRQGARKGRYVIKFTAKFERYRRHPDSEQPPCRSSESDFLRVSDYLPTLRTRD